MKKLKVGVIADDFTGASDAASFLVKSGLKTLMSDGPYDASFEDIEAHVIALKSRSVPKDEAISLVDSALASLNKRGYEKIYFKYCSTFDSTKDGNIGPVLDHLLEELDRPYALICPSLPINGRTLKDGILYVNGTPLAESPMKDHPLNPMWDSYIPSLLSPQSKYPCLIIRREDILSQRYKEMVEEFQTKYPHFYIVPDYETDDDGRLIAKAFDDVKILSGGSGLLEFLNSEEKATELEDRSFLGQSIILCGSCSKMTKAQVHDYIDRGKKAIAIDAFKLLEHDMAKEIFDKIVSFNEPTLIYSDGIDKDMDDLRKDVDFSRASKAMEDLLAKISVMAYDSGYKNIIVAGGETSGAVMKALDLKGFIIGKSIDPGVPELYPIDTDIRLVLKSGNFGSVDFFIKALGERT